MTECEAEGGVWEYCSAECAVFADNSQLEKQKLELRELLKKPLKRDDKR
jgi:hypothetical protein